jgi:hypothetical protein
VFRVEASSVYASTSLSSPSLLFPTYDDKQLCTLCLGILQFRFHGEDDNNTTNVPLLISDMVKRQGFHSPHHHSFSLDISIPSSIILNNDNTLRQYIKINYGSRPCFKDNTTFISAKDAFNFSLLPPLQTLLGFRCKSTEASFRIRLTYTVSKEVEKGSDDTCKRRKTGFTLLCYVFFFLIIIISYFRPLTISTFL